MTEKTMVMSDGLLKRLPQHITEKDSMDIFLLNYR
jgi:hypothetical protein